MKKIWMILLAMLLATGLVLVGCGSSSSDDDGDEFVAWESSGVIIPTGAGSNAPTVDATTGAVTVTASTSTGFGVPLTGYTYNRSDTLVFEYKIEVEVPSAVLNLKADNTFQVDPTIGDYGNGGGWEYALGDITRSNYEAGVSLDGDAIVSGTYDDATKTGTFEVLMRGLNRGTTTVWFQHNYWAQAGGGDTSKIAEDSKYTVTFTKIYNVRGEAIEEEGEEEGEDPEVEPENTYGFANEIFGNAASLPAGSNQFSFSTGGVDFAAFKANQYIVFETVSTNKDGLGGVQFAVQGDGVNDWTAEPVLTTGDWTSFSSTIGVDVIYIVIDLTVFDNYNDIIADNTATQGQFRVNYGGGNLGAYRAYLTNDAGLATAPTGAATLNAYLNASYSSGGTNTPIGVLGFISKTLDLDD